MSDSSDLSSLYFQWSEAVDDFRASNLASLTVDQLVSLKDVANQLDDLATHFTLADVAETLASIQTEVNAIKAVTADATKTLERLKALETVMKGVTAVVAMGMSALSGNAAGIAGAIGDLQKAVTGGK